MTISIDFKKIVAHGGSLNSAFEEFSSQLAARAVTDPSARFQRNGRGSDLGVECLWEFAAGDIHGWQAKYVFDIDGLKSQAENSFTTALERHPNLSRYYICIPFEPSAARGRGRSEQQKLQAYKVGWESLALEGGRSVVIEWWSPTLLQDRLLAIDAHGGRRLYWFGSDVFTREWFTAHLRTATLAAGPRYTPELNVGQVLTSVVDALGETPTWAASIATLAQRVDKAAQSARSTILSPESNARELPTDIGPSVQAALTHVAELTTALTAYERSTLHWDRVRQAATATLEVSPEITFRLEQALDAVHGEGSGRSKRFREIQAEYQASFPAQYLDRWNELGALLRELCEWLDSPEVDSYLQGVLLVTGQAGSGKTHSVCDSTNTRLAAGQLSLLLHGQRFRGGTAWEQIRSQLGLGSEWTEPGLLDALDAAAEASGSSLIIFVDALNESTPRQQWLSELVVLSSAVRQRRRLRLCVTCRTGFVAQVLPEGLQLARFEHPGFSGIEFDAIQSFFTFFELEPPVGPLFDPEFSNPLFLKLTCKTLKESGITRLPDGWIGFRSIFLGLLRERDTRWQQHHGNALKQAVTRSLEVLASEVTRIAARTIPLAEAINLLSKLGIDGSAMVDNLIAEELLTQLPGQGDPGLLSDPVDELAFAYERLGDHLQVQAALRKLNRSDGIPETMLAFAIREPGYAEALAIQLPEHSEVELLDLVADENRGNLELPWLSSLAWRALSTIGSNAEELLLELLAKPQTFNEAMNAAATLALRPGGRLDSRWLQTTLWEQPFADRDPLWCMYLHDGWQASPTHPVRRIIAAAWHQGLTVPRELLEGWLRVLCLMFATPHRRVRDRATRSAIQISLQSLDLWLTMFDEAFHNDDDYILERVLASAYGAHLRSVNDDALTQLTNKMSLVFDDHERANALIRDHARCICDLALRRGLSISVLPSRLTEQLESEWPLNIPSEEALKTYQTPESRRSMPRLYDSTVDDYAGDFAIYTITYALRPYKDVISSKEARRWVFQHVLDMGYSARTANFDGMIVSQHGQSRSRADWAERIGKKYQWIALARLLGRVVDHVAPTGESYDALTPSLTATRLRDIDVSIYGEPAAHESRARDADLMTGLPEDDETWVTDSSDLALMESALWRSDAEVLPLEVHVERLDGRAQRLDQGFRRQAWLQVRSYLVPAKQFERVWKWAIRCNFEGRWMPEGLQQMGSDAFIGEYPCGMVFGPSMVGLPDLEAELPENEAERLGCTRSNGPHPLLPTTHGLTPEFGEDCSDARKVSLTVPIPQLVRELRWNGKGGFLDATQRLVYFDPSAENGGPSGCFVDVKYFERYLETNALSLLWTVLGEKMSGTYEAIPRLEYSHVRGWHSGALRSASAPLLSRPRQRERK